MSGRDVHLRLSIGVSPETGREALSASAPVDIDFQVDRSTVDRLAGVFSQLTQPSSSSTPYHGAAVPIQLTIKVGAQATAAMPVPQLEHIGARRSARDVESSAETNDPLAQFPHELLETGVGGMFAFEPAGESTATEPTLADRARHAARWHWPLFRRRHVYGDYQPLTVGHVRRRRLPRVPIHATRVRLMELGRTFAIHAGTLQHNAVQLWQAFARDARRRWSAGQHGRTSIAAFVQVRVRRIALAAALVACAGVITGFLLAAPRTSPPIAATAASSTLPLTSVAVVAPPPVATAPAVRVARVTSASRAKPTGAARKPVVAVQAAPVVSAPVEMIPAARVEMPALTFDESARAARAAEFVGSVLIESQPSGGQIFVNQRPVGVSPLLLPKIRVGSYAVWVDLEGYSLWSRGIRVVSNEQTRVSAMMERLPESVRTLIGDLRLTVESLSLRAR